MFFSIKIYHTACFFQAQETVLSAIGGCSVEQGLFFAPSTVRKCTFVHDQTGTGARLEIARDAPPQFEQLSQKMGQ